ncbi:hypothetical protein Q3G72_022987 [Acer saccharum]|nr:hypothetical protein Q3G72_022987 [Acer saccharum]
MEKYFSLISLNQDSVTVVTIQPSPLSLDDFVMAHAFTTLISVHVVFSLSNFSQIVIDSCCCVTFAEYQKRGEDFWSEFELYLADLLVGVVVDIALVVFLKLRGQDVKQRVATYFYKGVLYGSVGFGCGLIGQGIANMVMTAKRFE